MKYRILTLILVSTIFSGCACLSCQQSRQESHPVAPAPVAAPQKVVYENNIRGTVTQPWAETMHDTVKVPGQIDPTNTYYRAPHQTVVEIRPGRYSGVKYDGETK
jgi:hypothetical protein